MARDEQAAKISLTIKRPVQVMVIVTEEFKKELSQELQEAADNTQRRIEQMEFQGRRYLADVQRADLNQAMAVRQQLEGEKRKLEQVKKEVQERLEEVSGLEPGSEYPRGALESIVEIKPGDNLLEKLNNAQVIIKDGIVQEIRD
ncbi:MAG: hypothetical protein GTN69_09770 [Armatimonadetes bacterium]|nr:hypothetical protein [Armatimonadota bacterium]NIO76145.1 hypothetical protein [Armatimonadota bacterium]NIO98841.1 hypothetical protein [Armatimonadota bacterium]